MSTLKEQLREMAKVASLVYVADSTPYNDGWADAMDQAADVAAQDAVEIAANLAALQSLVPGDRLMLPCGQFWEVDSFEDLVWRDPDESGNYEEISLAYGSPLIQAAIRGGAVIRKGGEPSA